MFRGFTLIELLIALTVVALLTTVALPGYLEHIQKSRRAEGKSALLQAAQLQERRYSTMNAPISYADTAGLAGLFGLASGTVYSGQNPALTTGYYSLIVDPPTATCALASCFVLRAIPNGAHVDPKCGELTLSSTGVRTHSGTIAGAPGLAYCWAP